MSAFRNIIARRRPSGPATSPETPVTTETPPASVGTRLLSPSEMLEPDEAMRPPRHARPRSRPVIDEQIPRWEIEPPRRTIGEMAPAPQEGPDDFLSAFIKGESATPSVDPQGADSPHLTPAEPETRIWDLDPPVAQPMAGSDAAPIRQTSPEPPPVPAPDAALAAALTAPGRSGRAKTRLLGFHGDDVMPDLFSAGKAPSTAGAVHCPVGFLAIVGGPGFGASFALSPGLSTLGRGADQTVILDYGDDSISRSNHASIAYDEEENKVLIGHGGKSNLVRLNGRPLVSATELASGDRICIGKTTLLFVALCGEGFSWTAAAQEAARDD